METEGTVPLRPVSAKAMFEGPADAYDSFMGRYSRALAPAFADFCLPSVGRFLDVGCGPGALTAEAVARLGATSVAAADPVAHYVEACRRNNPGVEVVLAPVEALPFTKGSFDAAAAQLVFYFLADPGLAVAQLCEMVRPGGLVSASVWDGTEDMEMLNAFWEAAESLQPDAPSDQRPLQLGRPGELAGIWRDGGLEDVTETTMRITTTYSGFEELWNTFLAVIGSAGNYALSLGLEGQTRLKTALWQRLSQPSGPFELAATARSVRGQVPC